MNYCMKCGYVMGENEGRCPRCAALRPGWECPSCHRRYSPDVEECKHCNEKNEENVRIYSQT